MPPLFGRDKRKAYRVRAAHGSSLSAELLREGHDPEELVVVDTASGGCRLLVTKGDAKQFEEGATGTIRFRREGGATARTVGFKVMNQEPDKNTDGILVGCAFEDVGDFLLSLNKDWWVFFNRRSSLRVPREPAAPIRARSIVEGFSGETELENLSLGGCCLRLNASAAQQVRPSGKGRMVFTPDPEGETVRMAVRVVHITPRSSLWFVGVRFEEEQTPDFATQEELLTRWFVQWQGRAART